MKPWYQSRTVWINTLTLAVGAVAIIAASDALKDQTRLILILTTIVIPIANLLLRWLTDRPITSISREFDVLRPNIKRSQKK